MSRSRYFDYIEEKINTLATRINSRGKLNILNLHIHSEDFYAYFLNELYGWNLKNENPFKQNVEAIDLIDHTNKYVIQVSATNTKAKIESSLDKNLIKQHATYTFKFISIAKDADDLKKRIFKNPHCIKFTPASDVIDKNSILNCIKGLHIDDQRKIYDFIRKELGSEIDAVKLDSNLASIINILAKENWDGKGEKDKFNPFEIKRKIEHNNLVKTRQIIEEYAIYKPKIESIYDEFDSLGSNKSYSVLQLIGRYYIEESEQLNDSDTIFLNVCERIMERVQESGNFIRVEFDVLILCVDILVVDAFIRCKIFENPDNYDYVTP
jgi:hypothetical protein